MLLEMLSVKPRRKDGDGVALLPEEGQWPHVEDCVGSGTLCPQPAVGPPPAGTRLLLAQLRNWSVTSGPEPLSARRWVGVGT